jgi:hypothetical protein
VIVILVVLQSGGGQTFRQFFDDTFSVCPKIEIAENKVRSLAVRVIVESLEGVFEGSTPVFAVDRGVGLHGDEIGGVVEQVDVDQVENGALERPARPHEPFSGPFALGEKILGEFGFLFGDHSLDVARIDLLAFHRYEFEIVEIPNEHVLERLVNEIEITQSSEIFGRTVILVQKYPDFVKQSQLVARHEQLDEMLDVFHAVLVVFSADFLAV